MHACLPMADEFKLAAGRGDFDKMREVSTRLSASGRKNIVEFLGAADRAAIAGHANITLFLIDAYNKTTTYENPKHLLEFSNSVVHNAIVHSQPQVLIALLNAGMTSGDNINRMYCLGAVPGTPEMADFVADFTHSRCHL